MLLPTLLTSLSLAQPIPQVDYAQQLIDAIAAAQPPEGRDPSAPNASAIAEDIVRQYIIIQYNTLNWPLAADPLDSSPPSGHSEVSPFFLDAPTNETDRAEHDAAHTLLKALEEADFFASIDRLRTAPRCIIAKPDGPLMEMSLRPLSRLRDIVGFEKYHMSRAAADGNVQHFESSLIHALDLTRVTAFRPLLIFRLTAVSSHAIITTELRDLAVNCELSPPMLKTALTALRNHIQLLPPESMTWKTERAMGLDAIQRAYLSIDPNNQMTPEGVKTVNAISNLAALLQDESDNVHLRTLEQSLADANEFYLPIIDASDSLYARRTEEQRQNWPDVDAIAGRNSIVPMVIPAAGTAIRTVAQGQMLIKGLQLLLAIELHRATHNGTPPPTLEALVPDILPELPQDPFAKEGTFRYRVLDPTTDPRGHTYLLYSVGLDATDNNGRLHANQVEALRNFRSGEGYDYILTLPDNSASVTAER